MSWWQDLQEQASEYGAQLKEKAEELKGKAEEFKIQASTHAEVMLEKAEVLKSQASEHASKLQEQAEVLKQQYASEGSIDSDGINALLGRTPAPGDPQWERAVNALDFTYVTDRVIAMGMPHDRREEMLSAARETLGGTIKKRRAGAPSAEKPGNNLDVVAALLREKHPNRFMVWNFSEESYDYSKFDNQVLEYKFPGHPAPPLGLLFKICTSIENWLDADANNVACLHCLTGKGRTATIMSCFLTWVGEANSVMEALQMVADRRKEQMEQLTIPSQRRYLQYFSNMLDAVKPRSEPLLLLGEIRDPAHAPSELVDQLPPGDPRDLGCCPYIQLFKGGKLLFTTAWQSGSTSSTSGQTKTGESEDTEKVAGPAWCYPSEQSVAFAVDAVVQGDILIRCRHLTSKGARVSMFRAAFHTGYVPCGVLRLNKAQLDGACADDRFEEDFFIDLIFAPVTSKAPEPTSPKSDDIEPTVNTALARRERGLVVEPEARNAYDEMLHRDSRFWDEVSNRKERAVSRRAKALAEKGEVQDEHALSGTFGFDEEDHEIDDEVAIEVDLPSGGVGYRKGSQDLKANAALNYINDLEEDNIPGEGDAADLLEMLTMAGMDATPLEDESNSVLQEVLPAVETPKNSPPIPDMSAADEELNALSDLEKELGLNAKSETKPSLEVSSPTDNYDFDDDLDDFEGYLQSLTTPK